MIKKLADLAYATQSLERLAQNLQTSRFSETRKLEFDDKPSYAWLHRQAVDIASAVLDIHKLNDEI